MRQYKPDGAELRRLLRSTAPVVIIQGPIGSGKSLGCMMKLWSKAISQKKQADGKRRYRAFVFRDSYPKLEETTLKTWLDWFPPTEFGRFYYSKPFMHEIRVGDLEADIHFAALEDERAVEFFRSLEPTDCYFNELQYTPRILLDEAVSRVGRYPKMIDGGPVNPQVIADMNAPDETHWVPIMRGDVAAPDWMSEEQRAALVKPDGWEFIVQPPGLLEVRDGDGKVTGYSDNPKAENRSWLPPNYYVNASKGKTKSWIDANILNRTSARREGKPVFPDFRRDVHVSREPLKPIPEVPLIIGQDFGRTPAAIVLQYLRGRWFALHELIANDMGASKFGPLLKADLAQLFPGYRFAIWGDPSGDFRGQNDEQTPFQIFRSKGLPVQPAPSNLTTVRIQSVEAVLTRMVEGNPALVVSPTCRMLVAALDGGYHYRRLNTGGERYADTPEKDEYSHIADAFQYAILGGGEGRLLLTGSAEPKKPVNTKRPTSVFSSNRAEALRRIR